MEENNIKEWFVLILLVALCFYLGYHFRGHNDQMYYRLYEEAVYRGVITELDDGYVWTEDLNQCRDSFYDSNYGR